MEISEKIKRLERYSKALGDVSFTVSIKGKTVMVKLGKKYNLCACPDKDSATILSEALTSTVRTKQGQVEEVLNLLGQRCEQLSLPLFKGDVNAPERDGNQPEGFVSDSIRTVEGGFEKPKDRLH
jgi:hypothetical protein